VRTAPGTLLAFDPSISSTGLALFRAGVLVAVHRTTIARDAADRSTSDTATRAAAVATDVRAWVYDVLAGDVALLPEHVAFEWPQVYVVARSKGDPNSIVTVGVVAGAILGRVAMVPDTSVQAFKPAEWIGQLPKTIAVPGGRGRSRRRLPHRGEELTTPRGKLIAASLTASELSLVRNSNHDVVDAVGIGLRALKRLRTARVYPGASPG